MPQRTRATPLHTLAIAADSEKIGTFRLAWRYGQAIDCRSAPRGFSRAFAAALQGLPGLSVAPMACFQERLAHRVPLARSVSRSPMFK